MTTDDSKPDFYNPDQVEALVHEKGPRAAIPVLESLARQQPTARHIGYLADTCQKAGLYAAAANYYQQALTLSPSDATMWSSLADCLYHANRPDDAFTAFQKAFALAPQDSDLGKRIIEFLTDLDISRYAPNVADFLSAFLENGPRQPQQDFHLALAWLRKAPVLNDLWGTEHPPPLSNSELTTLDECPLLHTILSECLNLSANFEQALIHIRSGLWRSFRDGGVSSIADHHALIVSLAMQCHLNEFVFAHPTEEDDAETAIGRALSDIDGYAAIPLLALLACYCPLNETAWADRAVTLSERKPDSALFAALVRETVLEPRKEARIATTVEQLTPIDDTVSQAVQGQYEASPYPRWKSIARIKPRSFRADLKQQLPSLQSPDLPDTSVVPSVLIAGCGTGQHPIKVAQALAASDIHAIDLSRSSLAYAMRKSREMGIENLTFAQADILALGDWDARFDVIESVGVLHHLKEPMVGWRILRERLKPGGYMRIGLYSHHARRMIRQARAEIERHNYPATADGIRAFREYVFSLDADHPLDGVKRAYDFFSLSACRDLLFHVQEHQFTIPKIQQCLAELNLEFLGFQLPNARIWREYSKRYPDDPSQRSLGNWDAFERQAPGIFSYMYAFWCRAR